VDYAVVDGGCAPVVHQVSASREDRAALTRLREERGNKMCLAIPGQVIELVDEVNQIAKVDVVGVRRNINVSLLASDGDEARPGDWVLIHVGFALSKVDEEEAHATLALLQGMGRDYEQELEELKASVIE
jgi:hydrogenase expression/formation protein HypC